MRQPYTRPPIVSTSGSLPNSEPILGPFGTYFGRSINQVRSLDSCCGLSPAVVGNVILVHNAALPALRRVATGLAAAAANGQVYRITRVSAFSARTVDGTRQISRHGLADVHRHQLPTEPLPRRRKTDHRLPRLVRQGLA